MVETADDILSEMHDTEPTIRDLFEAARRGIGWAVIAAALVGGLAFVLSSFAPAQYVASAALATPTQISDQRDFGVTLVTAPQLDVAAYRTAIRSWPVLAEALTQVRGAAPESAMVERLLESLTVRAEDARTSNVLHLVVREEDATLAADLANSVAAAAIRWDQQRATASLETIIRSLEAQIASIDAELEAATSSAPVDGLVRTRAEYQLQLSSARALRTSAVGRLELLGPATPPSEPVAPRPLRNAVVAAFVAVFLVYAVLFVREALNTRVRDSRDLATVTGQPVLAEFHRVVSGRRGLPREASSYLRTAISFATSDVHPKIILVTSTGAGHGKSSVSIALAESFARQRYRTLLVDADLRKPVLGAEYGLVRGTHLSLVDALHDVENAHPVRLTIERDVELDILPSFEPADEPTELLANRMRPLLDRVSESYDVVVIDTAPVLPVADALTIAPHASGVLFAVSMPDAHKRQITSALQILRRLGVRMFGVVGTNISPGRRSRTTLGYGYGYGYGEAIGNRSE